MAGRVRVFIACSLDGFIAGDNDDLSWLTGADGPSGENDFGYRTFFAQVGALLMGRNTYRVVEAFETWSYEDRPVLVATHRELTPKAPTVRAVTGTIEELVKQGLKAAGERDLYIDGGNLIRQALDAQLVDELTVSIIPTVLGRGAPLFAGVRDRHRLTLVKSETFANAMVQLTLRPTHP